MKRKLVLVNPVNPARTGLTVNKSSRFPPIGLGIVAALTSEQARSILRKALSICAREGYEECRKKMVDYLSMRVIK